MQRSINHVTEKTTLFCRTSQIADKQGLFHSSDTGKPENEQAIVSLINLSDQAIKINQQSV